MAIESGHFMDAWTRPLIPNRTRRKDLVSGLNGLVETAQIRRVARLCGRFKDVLLH